MTIYNVWTCNSDDDSPHVPATIDHAAPEPELGQGPGCHGDQGTVGVT